MSKIISIANQKGGVGKTTTAVNIGAGLVSEGKSVLLIDLDPQGNLSEYVGSAPDGKPTTADLLLAAVNRQSVNVEDAIRTNGEGINYISSNILLSGADVFLATAFCREHILKNILRQDCLSIYDYVIIDCLPSLGILLVNSLTASDSVIIPVQAQKFALDGLGQLEEVIQMVRGGTNPDIVIEGVLLTMSNNTNMSKAVEEALEARYPDKLFITRISQSVEATNSSFDHKSLCGTKNSRLGAQYHEVVSELLGRQ